jgi:uncharacterized phage-associated protein
MSSKMTDANKLGLWIRKNHAGALTHLKLQKLSFYCYGAALAFNRDDEVGNDISFQAWDHGPVNVELWREYKNYGATPIPASLDFTPTYSRETENELIDILSIYSRLDAWSLRNQSHLEAPWQRAYDEKLPEIDKDELRKHFIKKFHAPVRFPEYLLRASNFAIDGIPLCEYRDIRHLAESVRQAFGE